MQLAFSGSLNEIIGAKKAIVRQGLFALAQGLCGKPVSALAGGYMSVVYCLHYSFSAGCA